MDCIVTRQGDLLGESLRRPLMSVILLRDVGETDPKKTRYVFSRHM